MDINKEAEQLLDDINVCKGVYTDDHETRKLKSILQSFERISKHGWMDASHKLVSYHEMGFKEYWKSLTDNK